MPSSPSTPSFSLVTGSSSTVLTGVYVSDVAPRMGAHGPASESERLHCHLTSSIFMSGSVSVAVRACSTAGCEVDMLTEPGSSTFVTVMTKARELLAPSLSVVMTVTWYMLFPSASAGDS